MDITEITDFISNQNIISKDDLVSKLQSFLGQNIIRIYQTTNTPSIVLVFKADKKYIIKIEYSPFTPEKTIKQIRWYQFLNKLGKDIACVPHFINGYVNNRVAFYYLEYLQGYTSLDRYIINQRSSSGNTLIAEHFKRLIILTDELFYLNKVKVENNVWQKYFINRTKNRLKAAKHFPYLKDLLHQKEIIINGNPFKNFSFQLENLADMVQIYDKYGEKIGFQHGDLHLGNVFIKDNELRIIDPNGALMLPRFYDLGKLLQGIHGGYDLIHNKRFKINQVNRNSFIFSYPKIEAYDILFSIFKEKVPAEDLLKSLISEVYHFISMLSHHANNKEETTALYLQSVLLFTELRSILES